MDAVMQAFYDQHPYPPPVSDLDGYKRRWMEGDRLRFDYHLHWPDQAYREDLEILVAGCGTSQAAKHAIRQPEANVIGIDLSSNSLEYSRSLKQKFQLDNLEIRHLPIEHVQELDRQFDKIICTGVLHHLPDPDSGLSALNSVLKPEGAMHLMVYASYGRTGIYMLQDYCRRLGLKPSDAAIDDLILVLKEVPRGHPIDYLLRESPDFHHTDAIADALLNPRDHAYSVPQLFEFLERCGLTFRRWVRQAPYLSACGVIAETPHGSRLASLPLHEQYAALELFRGTISSHSCIVVRDDHPGDPLPINFINEDWLNFVPIRSPNVVCITDRVPDGTAAALINQEHTHTDLVHTINSFEFALFKCIDGTRTIADIFMSLSISPDNSDDVEKARAFFERLWNYDQVVYDVSRGSNSTLH